VLTARRMIAEFGERWPAEWLRARSFGEWADYLDGQLTQEVAAVEHLIAANGYLNSPGIEAGAPA